MIVARASLVTAFLRRDWAIARSYRAGFVLDLLQTLFSLALFFYLARSLTPAIHSTDSDLEDGYFAFVVVGLALVDVLLVTLTGFSNRLREDQTTGTLEALMSTPASPPLVILGSATFDVLRGVASGGILFAAAIGIFGFRPDTNPSALLAVVIAFAAFLLLFCAIGVGLAAIALIIKRVAGGLALMVSAVSLLSGVYYPITVLPQPLETLARICPFTWAIDVMRAGLISGEVRVGELLALLAATVVALPLGVITFNRALDYSRRNGTLAEY